MTTRRSASTVTLTDDAIEALGIEAGQAGDLEQVRLCEAALAPGAQTRSSVPGARQDRAACLVPCSTRARPTAP